MGSGNSTIVKGLDHDVDNDVDEIILDKCNFMTCPPENFTNYINCKNKNMELLFIIILLLIYFILIYNLKYI